MEKDTAVRFQSGEPSSRDALTEVLHRGARWPLVEALELEVDAFLAEFQEMREGKPRWVRNGYLPERRVQTGIGGVPVRVPRVQDRDGREGEWLYFHPRSCRATCAGLKASRSCLPFSVAPSSQHARQFPQLTGFERRRGRRSPMLCPRRCARCSWGDRSRVAASRPSGERTPGG